MRIVRTPPLILLLVVSLIVASAAVLLHPPWHWWQVGPRTLTLVEVVLPSAAWLLLLTVAFMPHGVRALWLLIGAPLAMFWPYQFATLALRACGLAGAFTKTRN